MNYISKHHYHLQARALDLNGNLVFGLVPVYYADVRADFCRIFDLENCEEVLVDPMTVEFYTGMRDAVTNEKIYEGDVVVYHHPLDIPMNCNGKDKPKKPLCEICLPIDLRDHNDKKSLYCHDVKGLGGVLFTDGFYEISNNWDSLDWEIVGNVKHKCFSNNDNDEPLMLRYALKKRDVSEAWLAGIGKAFRVNKCTITDPRATPFFGSSKRRYNIITQLFEHGRNESLIRRYPQFESLRYKWESDYVMYVGRKRKIKTKKPTALAK